ncbi:MAG: hypothetical protein KAW88_01340 [Candidatus Cloacimonetes bacterium]|nr:hypothetical protein [Candidatus Cloacimonadota bacterium]
MNKYLNCKEMLRVELSESQSSPAIAGYARTGCLKEFLWWEASERRNHIPKPSFSFSCVRGFGRLDFLVTKPQLGNL